MTERSPNPDLVHEIREKFKYVPNDALIQRIERAEDFSYDDEQFELNRRLKMGGLAWRWAGDFYKPRVEIYKEGEEG